MPVISQLAEVVKIGKTASGGLPAEASATIDAISQAQVAGPSMMPVPFPPGVIPAIPLGVPISIIMTKIGALMFKSFEDLSAITKQLMAKYQADLAKAQTKRKQALTKLNTDLLAKQEIIKGELTDLQAELKDINTQIPELQAFQDSEMKKYLAVIFDIKDRAKKKEDQGLTQERDTILEEIHTHDPWLAEIIKITVKIITLKLRLPSLEAEIEEKKYLATVAIPMNWETDVELADLFEVAVPPYPDLPDHPELPTAPPIPKESEFVKAMQKAFTMWLVTPMILPFGIPLAGILLYIQALAQAPAPLAAKLEAAAAASILQGGGLI